MTKELPLLCNSQVALNTREGKQTQDRRPMKSQPPTNKHSLVQLIDTTDRDKRKHRGKWHWAVVEGLNISDEQEIYFNPPHKVGDLLYVREGFALNWHYDTESIKGWTECQSLDGADPRYQADYIGIEKPGYIGKWRPSRFMPKWAARTWVKVKRVWVEQLFDISDEDCIAEGMNPNQNCEGDNFGDFVNLWYSMYGDKPDNPWLWCKEFEKFEYPK